MITLDLTNPNQSNIQYDALTFPDGEVQIFLKEFNRKEDVCVICRITNATDLFILAQVADILKRNGVIYCFQIKYLMGMRMDRVMDFTRPFTLKIVADIINSMEPAFVQIIEPHSERTLIEIKTSEAHAFFEESDFDKYLVVFPDAGAAERYREWKCDKVICSKIRDANTGKLTGFSVENPSTIISSEKPLMVVDDLCDGGGTFVGIAKAIREVKEDVSLSITVTHMVNRKGIENLSEHFDKVFFTDTYKEWDNLPYNCKMLRLGIDTSLEDE